MTKKILSVVLAALMCLSIFPLTAFAADNSGMLRGEILSDDNYFHMEYVEDNNMFKDKIDLYTALGLYDNAWDNYFTGAVNIDYAKAVLLGVIEKIEADYKNQTYEEVLAALGKASDALEAIETVNGYIDGFTDVLEFTESAEWATSLSILNTALQVANYGNRIYEAYVEGYAAILSAKAASVYYGNFLTGIIDNCENDAVVAAATEIVKTIDDEMSEAVKQLVLSLTADCGKDAAKLAANIALDSYSVTAAIKSGYNVSVSVADKLFNTQDKYEYMMSLVEVYCIEKAIPDWAASAFRTGDAEYIDFAEGAYITLRETGEALLANLVNATQTALIALVKDYDLTEVKIRTSVSAAKLAVLREVLAKDAVGEIASGFALYGDADTVITDISTGKSVSGFRTVLKSDYIDFNDTGVFANVYNETLDTNVKVAYLYKNSDYDVTFNGINSNPIYFRFDSASSASGLSTFYGSVYMKSDRSVKLGNVNTWRNTKITPEYEVSVAGVLTKIASLSPDFSISYDNVVAFDAGDDAENLSIGERIKLLFDKLFEPLRKFFNLFK
ncbi:MAG: hypothetical protein GX051_10575 [Clostridiales bacterium]|nr:hypothetical protein [Clostridiales bacterium]